jgi:hypothetical protein
MMNRNEKMKEILLTKVYADMKNGSLLENTTFEINDIMDHYTHPTQLNTFGGLNISYLLRDLEQTVSSAYYEELFQIVVSN